jgi:phage/plasmid-associated DNA primase
MDESIQYHVNSREWATTFLAFMVQTLKEGKGFQKLETPGKVMEYTAEYRNENDAIAKFMDEKVVLHKDDDPIEQVTKVTLRTVFKSWKMQNDYPTLTAQELEKRIVEKYGSYPTGGWTKFRLIET